MVPYANAGSYGSLGSHGSYNDNTMLGSSYGSYGEGGNMFTYFSPVGPSGMNIRPQSSASFLGGSPDARRRFMHYSHGNGLGMSPTAGNFAPLPLGTSPSQFTPPGSYGQFSAGSPGHYGPTSPARSNSYGSPLGKVSAGSQYNRRKSSGYSGSSQPLESSPSLHRQGQGTEGTSYNQTDGNSQIHAGSQSAFQPSSGVTGWKQHRGANIHPSNQNVFGSPGSQLQFAPSMGTHDKTEISSSLPDPGDWDPNYRFVYAYAYS